MRRSLCCAVLVLAALAAAPLAGGATSATQRDARLEQGILKELNQLRAEHGLRALTPSRELQSAAAFQTRALLTQGLFDHDTAAGGTFTSRLRRFYPVRGARSWSVGENLLWSSPTLDAPEAIRLWLDSPPHRRNMLDPNWREVGIAGFDADSASGVYASAGAVVVVTVDFGARTGARAAV